MTAARSPRSAALLVGSTSEASANVHSAGQSFKRFFASARRDPSQQRRLPSLPPGASSQLTDNDSGNDENREREPVPRFSKCERVQRRQEQKVERRHAPDR